MARTTGARMANGRTAVSRLAMSAPAQERGLLHRVPIFFNQKSGGRYGKLQVSPKEQTASVLARVAKAMTKPGADRSGCF
jgi:hypothetical protein